MNLRTLGDMKKGILSLIKRKEAMMTKRRSKPSHIQVVKVVEWL